MSRWHRRSGFPRQPTSSSTYCALPRAESRRRRSLPLFFAIPGPKSSTNRVGWMRWGAGSNRPPPWMAARRLRWCFAPKLPTPLRSPPFWKRRRSTEPLLSIGSSRATNRIEFGPFPPLRQLRTANIGVLGRSLPADYLFRCLPLSQAIGRRRNLVQVPMISQPHRPRRGLSPLTDWSASRPFGGTISPFFGDSTTAPPASFVLPFWGRRKSGRSRLSWSRKSARQRLARRLR